MDQTVGEVKRLQGGINNLISVLALPAIWSGHEPREIVGTLLDSLLGMLRLDFAYARLIDSPDAATSEVVRLARRHDGAPSPRALGDAIARSVTGIPLGSPRRVPNPIGDGDISIAGLRLGIQPEVGLVVAGSRRTDFPTQIERLLLRVAANQAAIGLREARLLAEQSRAAQAIRFQAGLLDAVDQAVVATDPDGVVTYWNRRAPRGSAQGDGDWRSVSPSVGTARRSPSWWPTPRSTARRTC